MLTPVSGLTYIDIGILCSFHAKKTKQKQTHAFLSLLIMHNLSPKTVAIAVETLK